jgi:hypothetical protein
MVPRFDDGERLKQPPPWEPEPLEIPLELPRKPDDDRDEGVVDVEARLIIIDLV